MKVTENAFEKLITLVKPNSCLAEGIRISKGNGCCGPAVGLSLVKQPYQSDIKEVHSGINIYIDNNLSNVVKDLELDFANNYFNLTGIEKKMSSGCC